ncbi:hypothetical protein SCLARK_001627 [Spiroplasma clarkii]|uniref:Uncharacterized protein n=1 Tax=Spiroplasma clarkii TaxID=2139 RepID=A0A1Y0L264_9MOLU|nr:hypothetical protein [Spiroplasma clarkii]ARU92101.1 hypothetical protein SCLARK_001627 [Spiroplasma clarkii]ATX71439.1 hypothetical protein SCLAR_v1c11390 [Spiroplasma clarkii]
MKKLLELPATIGLVASTGVKQTLCESNEVKGAISISELSLLEKGLALGLTKEHSLNPLLSRSVNFDKISIGLEDRTLETTCIINTKIIKTALIDASEDYDNFARSIENELKSLIT